MRQCLLLGLPAFHFTRLVVKLLNPMNAEVVTSSALSTRTVEVTIVLTSPWPCQRLDLCR